MHYDQHVTAYCLPTRKQDSCKSVSDEEDEKNEPLIDIDDDRDD